jgi:DNA replication protein DnaC
MEEPYHFKIEGNTIQYDFHKTLIFLRKYARANINPQFKFHKEDHEILKRLFVYSIDDVQRCQEYDIDLNKGILLLGPIGCGKTTLMKVFNHLTLEYKKYTIRATREITSEFIEDGFQVIPKYGKNFKAYCFDDLGVEQSMKHFGNECNVMGEILLSRYDLIKTAKRITHATTNLNANELEKIYGNRVRSRLREMFNLVSFPESAKDKRK